MPKKIILCLHEILMDLLSNVGKEEVLKNYNFFPVKNAVNPNETNTV